MRRALDILLALALALTLLLALPFGALCVWLLWREGRPLFYVAERMRAPGRPFRLWKLRTMAVAPAEEGVSGGNKAVSQWFPVRERAFAVGIFNSASMAGSAIAAP